MDEPHVRSLLEQLGCSGIRPLSHGWIKASCPFAPWLHAKGSDAHPSFGVSVKPGASGYSCFTCKKTGSLQSLPDALSKYMSVVRTASFVSEHDRTSFSDVAASFDRATKAHEEPERVQVAGVYAPRAILPRDYASQPEIPESELHASRYIPEEVSDYLSHRNVTPDIVSRWELGYDGRRGRVIIPVRDCDGKLVSVSGRAYEPWAKPKFLHTKGYLRDLYLYGEHRVKTGGPVYLVEGFFDAIMLQEWGYPALAVCGVSLSKMQLFKVAAWFTHAVILFDGDKAGVDGQERVLASVAKHMPVSSVRMPDGLDPDELVCASDRLSLLGPPPVC